MSCLLPEFLNEIFENLEDDKITLHSCLLVSRFWCKISVRILWRDIWSNRYRYPVTKDHMLKVDSAILSTLISCLPTNQKSFYLRMRLFTFQYLLQNHRFQNHRCLIMHHFAKYF